MRVVAGVGDRCAVPVLYSGALAESFGPCFLEDRKSSIIISTVLLHRSKLGRDILFVLIGAITVGGLQGKQTIPSLHCMKFQLKFHTQLPVLFKDALGPSLVSFERYRL